MEQEQQNQPNQQQPYTGYVPQGAPQQPDYYKPKPSESNEVRRRRITRMHYNNVGFFFFFLIYSSSIFQISPLIKPTDGALIPLITWYLTVPIHYMCRLTLPDCKSEKYKNWYPFTFVLSMIWISFYSYIMVWMITICGKVSVSCY